MFEPYPHPAIEEILAFFREKGLAQLKKEDQEEKWYEDFVNYVRKRKTYAKVLHPTSFSLRAVTALAETFGYTSPAHGYSFQVTVLGLFPFLMSQNEKVQREALEKLEAGGLFAFGLSERAHGSDIYASETKLRKVRGQTVASGKKYYIGNANCAELISVLAVDRTEKPDDADVTKEDFVFFTLRPSTKTMTNIRKIPTLGVKTAFVGEFDICDHALNDDDIICRGRDAWDTVFGTVNIGKFLLGFGSIGICERALAEAQIHTQGRILFGKPVSEMAHIRKLMGRAYAKILAMKLFATRAVDYLQGASPSDRRYLLTNSVQKAKVSTEGLSVMQILAECMGAKGFETSTYFESAMRDILLIPGLEGSTHINYGLTTLFAKKYFFGKRVAAPAFSVETPPNAYLFRALSGGFTTVEFASWSAAYSSLKGIGNVSIFLAQVAACRSFFGVFGLSQSIASALKRKGPPDMETAIELGKLFSTIVYGQLIAEQAVHEKTDGPIIDFIFAELSQDLSERALKASQLSSLNKVARTLLLRAVKTTHLNATHVSAAAERLRTVNPSPL
jgi:acyl-CoA dehydrogenase